MKQPSKRTLVVNTFGTLGYISVIFQWVWSLLLLAYPLITASPDLFLQQHTPKNTTPLEIAPAFSPLLTVIAIATTVLILIATTIVVARLPKTVGQGASRLTKTTAKSILPAVARHKKISKKERQRLSYRIILVLKAILVGVPLVVLLFARPIEQLDSSVMWAIALFAAACSLAYFCTQQIVAYFGKIPRADIW